MADRKVLNKYYPPDFDPSKLPRGKKPKNKQEESRIMLPMSIQCVRCGEFIYKGKKFNAFKEEAVGEAYLGIKVWRFYFKCPYCTNEITFKTDPKNANYTVEHGATRNYEPWRAAKEEEDTAQAKRAHEDEDAMKRLENKAIESKREMAIADAIEELRERNSKGNLLTFEQVVDAVVTSKVRDEEAELIREAKAAFERGRRALEESHGGVKDDVEEVENGRFSTAPATANDPLLDLLVIEERRRHHHGDQGGGNGDSDDDDDDDMMDGTAEELRKHRQLLASSGMSFAVLKREQAESTTAAATASAATTVSSSSSSTIGSVVIKKRKADEAEAFKHSRKKHKHQHKEAKSEKNDSSSTAASGAPAPSSSRTTSSKAALSAFASYGSDSDDD